MPKYEVYKTVVIDWHTVVEADDRESAIKLATEGTPLWEEAGERRDIVSAYLQPKPAEGE